MLNVNYRNRIGYYTETQGENKFKMWICHANCLCAIMYFYKKEEDGKTVDMAQLHSFFADIQHVKNCIKDGWFKECSNFHFYAKEMDAELWKFVRILADNGKKVTIE